MKRNRSLWFWVAGLILIVLNGCGGGGGGGPRVGTLQITTTPAGVKVLLDGVDTGKVTPTALENVPAGEHTLRLEWRDTGRQPITATLTVNITGGIQAITFDFNAKGSLQVQPLNTPAASNSLQVTVKQNGTVVKPPQLVARIQNRYQATIADLPAGDVGVSLVAYPNADGTGTPVAQATQPATVIPGQTPQVRPTLQSTIARLEISAVSPEILVNNHELFKGQQGELIASAFNAQNQSVPIKGTLQWQSADPTIATVEATGDAGATVTGVLVGTTHITVQETESGVTVLTPFTIKIIDFPGPPGG